MRAVKRSVSEMRFRLEQAAGDGLNMSAQGCLMSTVSLGHAAALLLTHEAALMPERRFAFRSGGRRQLESSTHGAKPGNVAILAARIASGWEQRRIEVRS